MSPEIQGTPAGRGKRKVGGVEATLARHGGLSYLEIPAADAGASAAFYQRVLGWKIHRAEGGAPKFSDADGLMIGRWIVGRAAARAGGIVNYFYVNDVRAAVSMAQAAGGEIVRDPGGNLIGIWTDDFLTKGDAPR